MVDDESVSSVGVQTVLKQNAYVLFYSKRKQNMKAKSNPESNANKTMETKASDVPSPKSQNLVAKSEDSKSEVSIRSEIYLGTRKSISIFSLSSQFNGSYIFLQNNQGLINVPQIQETNTVEDEKSIELDSVITSSAPKISDNEISEAKSAKSRLFYEERRLNRDESTWEGIDCSNELAKRSQILSSLTAKYKRKRDYWDVLLDQGKQKKLKSPADAPISKNNAMNKFQQMQAKKTLKKTLE
jgi:hypothetical protein